MRWESVYRLMQSHNVILLCVPDTDVIPFQPWETMIHFQMDLVYLKKIWFYTQRREKHINEHHF